LLRRQFLGVITKPDKAAVIQSGGNEGTGFFLSAVVAMTRKDGFLPGKKYGCWV